MSECYVRDEDYRRFWKSQKSRVARNVIVKWAGEERRIAQHDRRSQEHERRWEKARGRRFRTGDRRS